MVVYISTDSVSDWNQHGLASRKFTVCDMDSMCVDFYDLPSENRKWKNDPTVKDYQRVIHMNPSHHYLLPP